MCLLSRVVFWMVRHSIFKVCVVGQRNAPYRGPALLAANHVTYADGFLIGSCVRPPIRFLAWEQLYRVRFVGLVLQAIKAIPVRESSPREVLATILQARQALAEGHVICIFPEGYLTRTGDLLPFKRGMEKIVEGLDVPIIPIHLDRLWGSVFSFAGGRFFWKRPQHLRHPVTISFGAPMPSDTSVHEVRQAIQQLGAEATSYRYLPTILYGHKKRRNQPIDLP